MLTFDSDLAIYSYLEKNAAGEVVRAAEKKVISRHASAGTYFFRSGAVYLRAVAHALEHAEKQMFKNLFFVCPLMNGVLGQSLRVLAIEVEDLRDVKTADAS